DIDMIFSKDPEKAKELKKILSSKSSCENIMCENKIFNKKDYLKWLTKNHPDKFFDKVDQIEKNDFFKINQPIIKECVDNNEYCTE
ncbi:MAG: hypothetical protein WD512_16910, partial [Candidatus Paceibacterota bacterium]